jgi:hypothetical protein
MTSPPAPRTPTTTPYLVLVALAGAAVLLLGTSRHGQGYYGATGLDNLAAAQSLLEGRGFLDTRGLIYSLWPPFFPVMLAGLKLLGIEYMDTVRWSSAAAFFFISLLGSLMVLRVSRSRWLAILCAFLLSSSPVLVNCFRMTRSEPLFMAFVLASTWALDRYAESPTRRRFAVLVAFSAMAGLQRYMGITLLIPIALVLLLLPREQGFFKRATMACLYFGLSFFPLTCWMLRNWIVERTLTGIRWSARITFWENMRDPWDTFYTWSVPSPLREQYGQLFFLWAALVLVFLLLRFASAKYTELRALICFMAFPFAFYVGSIAFGTRIDIDPLLTRLMMPTYPFAIGFTLLAAHAMVRHVAKANRAAGVSVTAGLLLLMGVYSYHQIDLLQRNVHTWVEKGAGGFATDYWVASEAGAWLDENGVPEGRLWSNTPEFVFMHTLRNSTYVHIGRQHHLSQKLRRENIACTIVWITDADGRPRFKRDVFEEHNEVAVLASFSDGAVYALAPLPGDPQ